MRNLRLAVLISGAGSTLQNLIHWKYIGELPVDFQVVISSSAAAGGIDIAREAGIPVEIVCKSTFAQSEEHSEAIFSICRAHQVQLVVMGGYLQHLSIPVDFTNRVVNIHPALIPAFSGKGFYGKRVHRAALDCGVKLVGCTVHFVDDQYDHGPIIAQRACPVFEADTVDSLQSRVGELERQLLPEVIAAIARDQVSVKDRKVALRTIV